MFLMISIIVIVIVIIIMIKIENKNKIYFISNSFKSFAQINCIIINFF